MERLAFPPTLAAFRHCHCAFPLCLGHCARLDAARQGCDLTCLTMRNRLRAGGLRISRQVTDLLCNGALFMLRRREPNLPRPYRAFGYP